MNTSDVDSFVGFHGMYNEDHIESLGIITQDVACSADPDTPDNTDNSGGGGSTGGNGQITRPEAE